MRAAKFLRAAGGFLFLILIIEADADRVVHVMRFRREVRDGELDLMRPERGAFRFRREPQARTEIEEDRRDLADNDAPVAQERRRESGMLRTLAFHERQHLVHAALAFADDIDIGRARLLQREADIFAAAGNARPVEEFVRLPAGWLCGHGRPPDSATQRPSGRRKGQGFQGFTDLAHFWID
jgi:hypothetical protein